MWNGERYPNGMIFLEGKALLRNALLCHCCCCSVAGLAQVGPGERSDVHHTEIHKISSTYMYYMYLYACYLKVI